MSDNSISSDNVHAPIPEPVTASKERKSSQSLERGRHDAEQLRVEVEMRATFSPANLFSEKAFSEYERAVPFLDFALALKPLIVKTVQKYLS